MQRLITIILLLIIQNCEAQFLNVKTGWDFSKRQYNEDGNIKVQGYGWISGPNLSVNYEQEFNDLISMRIGPSFNSRGYKSYLDYTFINGYKNPPDTTKGRIEYVNKLYYLDVPLHLIFKSEIDRHSSFYGYLGLYVGCAIAGRANYGSVVFDSAGVHNNMKMGWMDLKQTTNSRWDFGLEFGGGVNIHNFLFEACFSLGLKNYFSIYQNQNLKTPYRSLYLSFGYRFEL